MKKGKEINNKPNPKEKIEPNKKAAGSNKNPKDLLPANSQHNKNIRETFPIRQTDITHAETNEIKEFLIFSKPFEILPEWPNEEELKNFSIAQENETELFTDDFNKEILFPNKFEKNFENEAKWIRPEEYNRNNLLNKEIKISFPNKNIYKIRKEVKEFYNEYELPNRKQKNKSSENNFHLDDKEDNYYEDDKFDNFQFNLENINKNEFADKSQGEIMDILYKKRNSFRDCFKILEQKINLKVVNWNFREETDEELKKRKEEEYQEKLKLLEKEKELKGKKKPNVLSPQNKQGLKDANALKAEFDQINLQTEERLNIKEIKPSNLYFLNEPKYNLYLKWLLSIFQIIKDLNICDVLTGKSIVSNIYPQKDNFPIISPSGKYWIKLYFMGKPRLIEIDDLIPCNKHEDFIFPRCDRLDEIWPALLTKAILKLHTYKRNSKYTDEFGDLSIIYNLTGYITEKIAINSMRVSNIEKFLQNNEIYTKQHKIIACVAWNEENLDQSKFSSEKKKKRISKYNKNENNKEVLNSYLNSNSSFNTLMGNQLGLKQNANRISSKKSILSINSNRSQNTEENKNINNPAINISKKGSINNKFKRANSIAETEKPSLMGTVNNVKGATDNIFHNSSKNNANFNFINLLKNIPEENNYDNYEERKDIFVEDKKSETSEFNSLNNENISNTEENNGNNLISISTYENNREKNSNIKSPKFKDFKQKLKKNQIENQIKYERNKHRRSTVLGSNMRGSSELMMENSQEKENRDSNSTKKNIIAEVSNFNTNSSNNKIEIENRNVTMGKQDNTIMKSNKNIKKYDFNLELLERPDTYIREDIVINYIYPILDFFDNQKFNMQRLKPIDFSDIKKMCQEGRKQGIYKQLPKDEKKKYLENLLELKTKQRELKNKRIDEIKSEGKRYNLIKIKNNTIGIPKMDFFVPYSEQEIFMTKKCLENNWEFPPPSYYDNYDYGKKEILESSVYNTENDLKTDNNLNNNDINKNKINNEMEILEEVIAQSPKDLINSNKIDKFDKKNKNLKDKVQPTVIEKQNRKPEFNIKNIFNINPIISNNPQAENGNEEIKKNIKNNKLVTNKNLDSNEFQEKLNKDANKNSKWSKDVYMNIINHNLNQYENSVEPLTKYNGGNWVNYTEFKKIFNYFLLLHHPRSFKYQIHCDNLWIFSNDSYEYNKNTSVIFLNNLSENLDLYSKSEIIKHKKSNLLIVFEPNSTLNKAIEFEDLFFYANFDLIDSFGKEVQTNIILSKFYSTYLNENLDYEKNYFLLLKSFVCPFGFNFSVFSDHACDCLDYGSYLKKFFGFENKIIKIEHPAFEKNKTSLIGKFRIKLIEKTYFKINLNHPDKFSKKFMELYLYFGKSSQNKKRINFDINEKILFDQIPDDEEYILALVIYPPYVVNANTIEVDFHFDVTSTKIDLLEIYEPFKLYDTIKANKYGIVFKEFIFAFENTYLTLELKVQNKRNFNFGDDSSNKITQAKQGSNYALHHINNSSYNASENVNNNNLQKLFFTEEDIMENIRMKLKISKSQEVTFEEEFFNKMTIQNILLNYEHSSGAFLHETTNVNLNLGKNAISNSNISPNIINHSNQKEYQPYLMTCKIDLSELKIPKESLENMEWFLRIYVSDPVLLAKDTSKEDSEKLLKDNWESHEPGRSEKARKSRLKHLIMCKKNMGKKLTIDEEQLLLEDRPKTVSTLSMVQHAEVFNNANLNAKAVKDNEKEKKNLNEVNKRVNNANIMTNPQDNSKQKTNGTLPKLDGATNNNNRGSTTSLFKMGSFKKPVIANPEHHKSHYIKKFLHYTEQERIIKKDNIKNIDQKVIMNEYSIRKKNEEIKKQIENFEYIRKTEGDETLNKSIISRDNLRTFYKTTNTFRVRTKDNFVALFKQRDLLKDDLIKVMEVENTINEILCTKNIDLNYAIGIYKESGQVEGVRQKLREKLFQYISSKKEEFFKAEISKLTNKDKNTIVKYMEDIQENKWLVSADIINKFKELIQETSIKK